MASTELFRLARRRAGLSQRELAETCGISARTVARVEAGDSASMVVLSAVLSVAGLELSAEPCVPVASAALQAHLRRSLPARVRRLLDGDGPLSSRRTDRWRELDRFSRSGRLVLVGPTAVGLWLPGLACPPRLSVQRSSSEAVLPVTASPPPWLDVEEVRRLSPAAVRVGMGFPEALTLSPAELALDPSCAEHRLALRCAARALHDDDARDDAGRRARGHRDPNMPWSES